MTDPAVAADGSLSAPGSYMCGLTWQGGLLWYSDQGAEKIFAIDRSDGSVVKEFDCPLARADLTYYAGKLCQVGDRPKCILLIDPETGELAGKKEVPPPSGRLCGVEAGPEGIWMCLRKPSVLQLRDFESMSVLREYPVPGGPSGLTYADGVLVYSEFEAGALRAVDASSGQVLGVAPLRGNPTGITWDGDRIWYCDFRARAFKTIRLSDVLARASGSGAAAADAGKERA